MKYLILLLFAVCLLGCEDDEMPTRPVIIPKTLIYSLDTLVISADQIISNQISSDSLFRFFAWYGTYTIEVNFYGETNFDSTGGIQEICIEHTLYDNNCGWSYCGPNRINRLHTFTLTISAFEGLGFRAIIYRTFTDGYKYLMIKGLTIYRWE